MVESNLWFAGRGRARRDREVSATVRPTTAGQTGSRLSRLFMTQQGRYLLLAAVLGGFVGYLIGLNTAVLENRATMQTLQQSRSENQKMKGEMAEQDAHSAAMESNVAKLRAALQELVPSENTYILRANQSLIVGGGRLTIGLIGSPTNESVTININGKRQSFATGDLINVPIDAQTNCQVRLQSFDMFRAIVMATCAVRQGG